MEIIHRVNANNKMAFKADLDRVGFKYEYEKSSFGKWISFEIAESDLLWPVIGDLISKYNVFDWVYTRFTETELKCASYVGMGASHTSGYPKPDGDFGYLDVTYDLSEYCAEDGTGAKQKGPFRIRSEPRWGRKHVFHLNWVFDEFFVPPEVWRSVFKQFGVSCLPVIHHRTGKELETVVQLNISALASSALRTENLPYETCSCGRKKCLPVTRGFFPSFVEPQSETILKSQEYFGSGGQAFRAVLVSSRVFQEIKRQGLKGFHFKPMFE